MCVVFAAHISFLHFCSHCSHSLYNMLYYSKFIGESEAVFALTFTLTRSHFLVLCENFVFKIITLLNETFFNLYAYFYPPYCPPIFSKALWRKSPKPLEKISNSFGEALKHGLENFYLYMRNTETENNPCNDVAALKSVNFLKRKNSQSTKK